MCFSTFLSTRLTVGSAKMLIEGVTISKVFSPPSFKAKNASFSHVTSTSPKPRWAKVIVEPRAPVSNTGTFLNSFLTNSFAFSSEFPYFLKANPQAAR